jgi:hypothetical protein
MAKTEKSISMFGAEQYKYSNGAIITYFCKKWILLSPSGVLVTQNTDKKELMEYAERMYKNLK